MPQNIFKIFDGRNYFWQWDTNQKLIVLDETVDEVHFSNRDMTHAISKDVFTDKDGKRVCYIPDVLLTLPKNLIAAAIVTDNNANKTLKQVKFAVQKRAIPSDYVVSDDVQSEDIADRLNIVEELVEDMHLNLPNTYDTKGSAEQALADAKLYMTENYDPIGSAESVMNNLTEEIARAKNEEAAITRALHQINDRVTDAQSDVGALEKLIGVLPNGVEVSTIVEYIDKKTEGAISDEIIRELDVRIENVENEIDTKLDDLSFVSYNEQELTDEQKSQARKNIGVANSQSDWSVNDETNVAYIANRPFYVDTVLNEHKLTIAEQSSDGGSSTDSDFAKLLYENYENCAFGVYSGSWLVGNIDSVTTTDTELVIQLSFSQESGNTLKHTVKIANDYSYINWIRATELAGTKIRFIITTTEEVVRQIDQKFVPNADWNVNDENSDGYVKHRTHYEEINVLVDSLTKAEYENGNVPACNFVVGDRYKVICNGTEYDNLVCRAGVGYNVIASLSHGCPFYIDDDGGNALFIECENDWTISIIKYEVCKIDPKYVDMRPEYIKDMYYDNGVVLRELMHNFTVENTGGYVNEENCLTCMLQAGDTYEIVWNGDIYECLARVDVAGDVYIGNQSLSDNWDFTEVVESTEPFFIVTYEPDFWSCVRAEPGSHTFSITRIYHDFQQIDNKYLQILEESYDETIEFDLLFDTQEYLDDSISLLTGKCMVTIDGDSEIVEFVRVREYSLAFCSLFNGNIEIWDGRVWLDIPSNKQRHVKIEKVNTVIKKEHLPSVVTAMPDWNVNSPEVPGYIKNRPMYCDIDVIVENLTALGNTGMYTAITPEFTPTDGVFYYIKGVHTNDKEVKTAFDGMYECIDGRIDILPWDGSGSPVLHITSDGINVGIQNTYRQASVVIDVIGVVTYHKLDERYIPDTIARTPKLTTVTMPAANWTGNANPWSQVVAINGVTVSSKVDLQPTALQIVALQDAEITLMFQNGNGVVTAWAIGNKPTEDYTMDVLITEVVRV